jgi:hypothetical protein
MIVASTLVPLATTTLSEGPTFSAVTKTAILSQALPTSTMHGTATSTEVIPTVPIKLSIETAAQPEHVTFPVSVGSASKAATIAHTADLKTADENSEATAETNTSALLDGGNGITMPESRLSVVTWTGLRLSLILLAATATALGAVEELRTHLRSTTVTLNLLGAFFLSQLLFVFVTMPDSDAGCKTLATSLAYCVIACFSWVMVDGYDMKRFLTNRHSPRMLFYGLFGWGLPAVLVAIAAMQDDDMFIRAISAKTIGTQAVESSWTYCWVSGNRPSRWIILAPLLAAILANIRFAWLGFGVPGVVKIMREVAWVAMITSVTCIGWGIALFRPDNPPYQCALAVGFCLQSCLMFVNCKSPLCVGRCIIGIVRVLHSRNYV